MTLRKTCAVVGGGTMGADIALTLARAGNPVHVVETFDAVRQGLPARLAAGLAAFGCPDRLDLVEIHAGLDEVDWPAVDLAIEAVPEKLELKRALFADLA
ncbi:MAG: NAD-binding protein, partial [Burkholderiales bacterium]|nr:NAD-binding protein [Burkholderiales bacterium]